ncbi:MAG: hypothetical protein GY835_26925 [bacterium]|nr:hypothetical protein [bacterium]
MRSNLMIAILILVGMTLLAGCGQKSVEEHRSAIALLAANPDAETDLFHVDLRFCRKVGKKTGKAIGVSDDFEMGKKSYVNAVVDFNNIEPGYRYAVHMIWQKPDSRQMFRKYAEVVCEKTDEGYISTIEWRKPLEINYLKEQTHKSDTPSFMLTTRLNTSLSKHRIPGEYNFKVCLHRQEIIERSFTLDGPMPPVEED